MEQEEITKIYETLAPMAGDYANAQAEQIGQAQRSMGPMAAAVQGTTTSGLGNYTYNRLMRPQVDVMRDEIRTQGYANQLNRLLSDALNNARNNYNRRSRGGGGGGGAGGGNTGGINDDPVKRYTDDDLPSNDTNSGPDTVSTVPSTAKEGEYNVGTATVNGETRIITKNDKDNKYHIQGVGSYRDGSSAWDDAKKKYDIKLNSYPGANPLLTF